MPMQWLAMSVLTGIAISLSSCSSLDSVVQPEAQPITPSQAASMSSKIPFQVLDFGQTPLEQKFVSGPQVFIFSNNLAWESFWESSTELDLTLQKPAAPRIDFEQQTVVGITAGSHATGGYDLRIDRIEPDTQGNRWIVHYTESAPAQNCLLTQAPTTPSVFITVNPPVPTLELQGQTVINESC